MLQYFWPHTVVVIEHCSWESILSSVYIIIHRWKSTNGIIVKIKLFLIWWQILPSSAHLQSCFVYIADDKICKQRLTSLLPVSRCCLKLCPSKKKSGLQYSYIGDITIKFNSNTITDWTVYWNTACRPCHNQFNE